MPDRDYSLFLVLSDGKPGQCQSSISVGQKVSLITMTTDAKWVTVVSTVTSASFINGIQMNGWNVAPKTTSSLASSTPSAASSSATSSPSSSSSSARSLTSSTSSSATSSISSTITTSSSSNSAHASNDNKQTIGISIGVTLAVVGVIAAILAGLYFWRRRSRPYQGPSYDGPKYLLGEGQSQLWDEAGNRAPMQAQEVHGSIAAHELEPSPVISELHNEPVQRGEIRSNWC